MSGKTKFTPAQGNDICERIMEGLSLREVCLMDGMPARSTVHKWLAENEKFSDQYARACAVRADVMFDEMFDIADNAQNDWMRRRGKDEEEAWVENGEAIRRSALRIDTRKWALARMAPKKYGDKLGIDHGGSMTVNLPEHVSKL